MKRRPFSLPAGPAIAAVVLLGTPAHAEPDARECIAASERGQEKRNEGSLIEAQKLFRSCAISSCPKLIRTDCANWFRELQATLPTVVLIARDANGHDLPDVQVELDGRVLAGSLDGRPIEVDPGSHLFRFVRGEVGDEQRVLIVAGEKNRQVVARLSADSSESEPSKVTDEPRAANHGSARSPLPWIIGGVGVLAIGVGAYVGIDAKKDLDALETAPCAKQRTCSQSEVDSVRRRFLIADIAMGAGVVAVGVATWLFISNDERSPVASRVRIDLSPNMARVSADF